MKWFALVLLILNVLYLGWEMERDTKMRLSNSAPAMAVSATVRPLQKLDELAKKPALRDGASPIEFDQSLLPDGMENELIAGLDERNIGLEDRLTPLSAIDAKRPTDQAGGASCFSFGPIPDRGNALALNDWFLARGIRSRLTDKASDTKKIFWIYLAPQGSRTGAMALIRELKNKGIEDYRLIDKGELSNAISLGLFSSQLSVNQRLRELHREGYQPVIVPYDDVQRIYMVAVRLEAGSEVAGQVFSGYPSGFNVRPIKCARI